MNWLAWRQHRKQFMVIGLLLIAFAAVTIPTGLNFWHTYQHALSTCGSTNTCDQLSGELFQSNIDSLLFHFIPLAVLLLPIILGLFWGVPLLAREYVEGTNKLAWTQSISRRKWLTVKLIWVLLGAVILTAAFTALDTWWFKTGNALNQNRFSDGFSTQGIVPVAYSVFAVSLGIMFGAWFRRTMVALGVTLFLLIAIMLILVPNGLRPHYETPLDNKVSILGNVGKGSQNSSGPASGASLILDQYPVSNTGQPLDYSNPPSKCVLTDAGTPLGHAEAVQQANGNGGSHVPIISRNGGPAININCLATLGYQLDTKYQPSYRYWDFQEIESGIYVGLSAIAITATYWLVLKRDA